MLVIGGGGAGGSYSGAEGGAGGLIMQGFSLPLGTNSITINVGAGGIPTHKATENNESNTSRSPILFR